MFRILTEKFTSLLLVIVIVVVFTAIPYNHKLEKQEAEAILPGLGTLAGPLIIGAILKDSPETTAIAFSSGANAVTNNLSLQKEAWYDGIFGMLAKAFLRQVTNSIVTWINSGFQGDPSFITDLDGFIRSVADDAINQFIYDDPALNFLCSPFQLDVKIALEVQYGSTRAGNYTPQCTLSDVVNNVDNFLAGSFDEGGWPGMIELVQTPENNPIGAYLSAQEEAYIRIVDAQGREIMKADWGDGFMSMEICDIADKQSGARPTCTIGTPGSVIANSINKALGAPQDELIAADEVNEIFNALFSQLAQKAISGVYGLLGLGGSNTGYTDPYGFSNGTYGTYLQAITAVDASTTISNSLTSGVSPISQSLKAEQDYQTLLNQAITRANAAEVDYNNTNFNIQAAGCTLSFGFPTEISDFRTDAQTRLAVSVNIEQILINLDNAYKNAADFTEQQKVIDQYNKANANNIFRSSFDNNLYDIKINNELIVYIMTMQSNLTSEETACTG